MLLQQEIDVCAWCRGRRSGSVVGATGTLPLPSFPLVRRLTSDPQAIHQKVLSLGLSNCKAFIHHIDTQPSFQGGILLQVIGEMSNASGPWRKFTQTFFLAEQPNGYYVLNDIFRYLKENDDEQEEDDEESEHEERAEAQQPTEEEETPVVQAAAEPIKVSADILTVPGAPGVSDLAEATAGVEEPSVKEEPKEASSTPEAAAQEQAQEKSKAQEQSKPEPTAEEPVAASAPVEKETAPAPAAEAQEKGDKPVAAPAAAQQQASAKQSTSAASPATTSTPPPPPAAGRRQSPSRGKQAQPQAQAQASAAPAPAPAAAPPKPRTWASTAAAKPNAWGTALATKEALSAPATAASALPAAKLVQAEKAAPQQQVKQGQAAGQAQGQGQGQGQGQKFPLVEAAKAVQTAICFVKVSFVFFVFTIPRHAC